MSSTLSLRQPGLPATDYYAPNFKVEVEGRELDPESKGDVLDLKVTMDSDNPSRRIPDRWRRPEACMAIDPVASEARPERDEQRAGFEPALPKAPSGTVAGDAGQATDGDASGDAR